MNTSDVLDNTINENNIENIDKDLEDIDLDFKNLTVSNKKIIKKIKKINIDETVKSNDKQDITKVDNIESNTIIDLDYIKNRIEKEICKDTLHKLNEINLLDEYNACKSVKMKKKKIKDIFILINKENNLDSFLDHNIYDLIQDSFLDHYIYHLIPPGTKGVIRGNKFNNIVKETINNLELNKDRFEICFEKKCELYITSEIPDWYILEKSTKKIIIGMNQLDLWTGGQQLNRGSKYLIDNVYNTEKSKLLCVVCHSIKFKSVENKAYKLFEIGFKNDTLCYIKNIGSIITKFFN